MSELKSCPFCGGEAHIERMGTSRVSMQIECGNCGAGMETGETWIDDNSGWNTRAPQSEWISVDKFRTSKDVLVHAYCNDIVNGWVECLTFTPSNELFFPHGTRFPAIVTHIQVINKPTPPKAEK